MLLLVLLQARPLSTQVRAVRSLSEATFDAPVSKSAVFKLASQRRIPRSLRDKDVAICIFSQKSRV